MDDKTLVMDPNVFLVWFKAQLESQGVVFKRMHLDALEDIDTIGHDVVVNASGFGSKFLTDIRDEAVELIRGQTIVVRSDYDTYFMRDNGKTYTYAIPRGDGTVVLGGVRDRASSSPKADSATTEDILRRLNYNLPSVFSPNPVDYEIINYNVGFRPGRKGGIRVERDPIRRKVVHAYGFEGGGYIHSFGAAREAARLVDEILSRKAQHPNHSGTVQVKMPTTNPGWGFNTTAQTVAATFPDAIKNRTILVTGVNRTGLGYATASAFASQSPSTIIITGRSQTKLDESLASLRAAYPSVTFKPLIVNLSSQASVREAAAEVLKWEDVPAIDIVVNNAGVMNIQERTLSVDGIEMHLATNHIGHFLLSNLIMAKILAGTNKRIVNVSSVGTFVSPIRFSDLKWETQHKDIADNEKPNTTMLEAARLPVEDSTTYIPFGAYGVSKAANILFTVGLNKKLGEKGVRAFALHPGEIMTELQRNTDPVWLSKAMEGRKQAGLGGFKSVEEGAATSVVAAVDPGLKGEAEGIFLEDCQVSAKVPNYAVDEEQADRLWEVSEGLVGEKFAW
ncbi:hypothetical protein SLS60_005394 [Paraconiothyrium brasiliense]|uniref:FAD dependent oxidoreductase domain-containing protein n=1 Tax=Paraconiothyrium brasiliense TaxID=300254 RepID=A0ABR3RH81_9PLEO